MSNPDSSTPSIQALNLAVKPAGFDSWEEFMDAKPLEKGLRNVDIAFAYAADLDKADKVGRMVREYATQGVAYSDMLVAAAEFILPDPIDPDLLEAREIVKETLDPRSHSRCNCRDKIDAGEWDKGPKVRGAMAGLRRGRELAKERSE